jgi:hypothetical protein
MLRGLVMIPIRNGSLCFAASRWCMERRAVDARALTTHKKSDGIANDSAGSVFSTLDRLSCGVGDGRWN